MELLTVKDVANLLNVSQTTARKYIKDIRNEYNLKSKRLTKANIQNYFKL